MARSPTSLPRRAAADEPKLRDRLRCAASPYVVPVLTTVEAARILLILEGRPGLAAIVRWLEAAVGADAVWREPRP